jgi:hypothetical protein
LQNGDGQTRGAAKAKKSNSLTGRNAGHAQAAKADNTSAKQGSDVNVIQAGGQREGEVCARQGVLGVASIDRISRKDRPIAEIFHPVAAVPAIAIDTANPGDTGTGSQRQLGRRASGHLSHDLMAGDKVRANRRQIPFGDVQVSTANPARQNPKQHISRLGLRTGNLLDPKE